MSLSDSDRQSLRMQLVDEHVRLENRHDLDGIMKTFGAAARYDDEPWDAHYVGHDGVRTFYSDLLRALPDDRRAAAPRQRSNDRARSHHSRPPPGLLARPAGDRPPCAISALRHLHVRR